MNTKTNNTIAGHIAISSPARRSPRTARGFSDSDYMLHLAALAGLVFAATVYVAVTWV